MSDYYTYHQQVVRQRRRRRVVIVLLALLVLLSIGVGAFYFLTGDADANALPVGEPLAAEEAEPAAEPTAEPTAEPVPVEPAVFAPHRILPPVDTAAWDTAQPVTQTIDYEYLNTDFRMAALPMLGTASFDTFNTTTFVGDSIMSGLGLPGYASGLQNAHYVAVVGGSPQTFLGEGTQTDAISKATINPQTAVLESLPDRLYFMCGTNTLVNPNGVERLQKYYADMIDFYKEQLPGVAIYIMAVTGVQEWVPTGDANHSPKPNLTPDNILLANNVLANIALSRGCYFVNTQEAVSNADGTMIDDYDANYDGIHFSPSGYKVMASYIATHTAWDPRTVYVGQNPYYIYGK